MTTPYRKKLIEVALPLDAINKASAREKSIRHGHPSTLHLWWARRPLAAARAVIFAQMVDDPSAHPDIFPTEKAQEKERQRLFRIIEDLVLWENSIGAHAVSSYFMPRTARVTPGGIVYHVLNRSVGSMHLFRKDAEFEAFQQVMIEAHERHPIRILSCSLGARMQGDDAIKGMLSPWPVARPKDWIARVNVSLSATELDRIRVSVDRGRPYGGDT